MTFDLDNIVRPNIRRLKPYSSARSEFVGSAEVFLDANENAFGSPAGDGFNRYPDPLQTLLKQRVGEINGIEPRHIFVGNGSDEAIDLLFRIFCQPGKDSCLICPPTYGMYEVSAAINDVGLVKVPLTSAFQLDVEAIETAITPDTKLIFICSPNNPTGNLMRRDDILAVTGGFGGIVVVDEAYIHFAESESLTGMLAELPNLVVLQTFSKAWAMAGLRVGLAFANPKIIDLMNRVKPPYNVSSIAQRAVLDVMENRGEVEQWINKTLQERQRLTTHLERFGFVYEIYPTDANFVLVRADDANAIYSYLLEEGIVVRNRNNVELCEGCLRVTVGTADENSRMLRALEELEERTRSLAVD